MPDTRGLNAYTDSPILEPVLARWLPPAARQWVEPKAVALGREVLDELDDAAADADRHDPQLHPYDKRGDRVDLVEFHPAFHEVVDTAYRRYGLAAMSHREGVLGYPGVVPEVAKQALFWLFAHADRSVATGLSMTDVLSRVLRQCWPSACCPNSPALLSRPSAGAGPGRRPCS